MDDTAMGDGPQLYDSLASWWPLMSSPAHYIEEAAFYYQVLSEACEEPPVELLELGSGGGNNASHMKAHARMVLVDRAPAMLDVSRALNPECEHILGDMRTIRVGRQFDAVFVHDAICYLTTVGEVREAIATAYVHCRPGGAALYAPDHVRENFQTSTDAGGEDGEDRALRYLEWTWDPDPADTSYTVEYAFLLRSADGSVRVVHDRHIEGLFWREEWLRMLSEAGFGNVRVVPFDGAGVEPGRYEVFVARRPL